MEEKRRVPLDTSTHVSEEKGTNDRRSDRAIQTGRVTLAYTYKKLNKLQVEETQEETHVGTNYSNLKDSLKNSIMNM